MERALSLPAVLCIVGLLLLPLPLPSHLLQLLSVFPLDEALLMSHLREVIWYKKGRPSGPGRRDKENEGAKETVSSRKVSIQPKTTVSVSNIIILSSYSVVLLFQSNAEIH